MTLASLKAKAEEVRPTRPDLILQGGLPPPGNLEQTLFCDSLYDHCSDFR